MIAVAITLVETWLPTSVLAELPPGLTQQIETLKKSKKRWLYVDLSEQQLVKVMKQVASGRVRK